VVEDGRKPAGRQKPEGVFDGPDRQAVALGIEEARRSEQVLRPEDLADGAWGAIEHLDHQPGVHRLEVGAGRGAQPLPQRMPAPTVGALEPLGRQQRIEDF